MNDDEEEIMNIDDPRVPDAIRAHGRRFRKPARFVVDVGNNEYVLSSEDGEVLDIVCLK
ncbi:hypothetical protein G7045_07565 [Acidovorax sp. HDW3]|uniref:hypothetical protein n=1 Tax=Acidovorax sp. HDW3 TaxID=2714923 RepID=UPI00140A112D|nr:hypothetical protein [Acidovorax sp. HDW3]QIL44136.1 hypothetical protein G7045_07565 [Acidovorax sp. HDW3]